jgi:hypothetical protein
MRRDATREIKTAALVLPLSHTYMTSTSEERRR